MKRIGRATIAAGAIALAVPLVALNAGPAVGWFHCGTPQAESDCPTTTTTSTSTSTTTSTAPASTSTTTTTSTPIQRLGPATIVHAPPTTIGDSLLPSEAERGARGVELPHTL